MAELDIQQLVEALREKAVVFETGLSAKEISRVEHTFGFRFPNFYRDFLTIALPVNRGFPNWRSESETSLRRLVKKPVDGVLFDVQHNGFWLDHWGPRPEQVKASIEIATEYASKAPPLVPIRANDYCPTPSPGQSDVVFRVRQTDIRPVADSIAFYLVSLFAERPPLATRQCVPFWSDAVSRSIRVPNLHTAALISDDEEYDRICNLVCEKGFLSERMQGGGVIVRARPLTDDNEKSRWLAGRGGDFWFAKYDFGWQVCIWGPRRYVGPPELDIADLCLSLLTLSRDEGSPPKIDEETQKKHELVLVNNILDGDDLFAVRLARWEEHRWRELSDGQQDEVWEQCSKTLGFPHGPPTSPPPQHLSWNVASILLHDEAAYELLEKDLRVKTLRALQKCTERQEELYALDWNHPCYFFLPHELSEDFDLNLWAVPVYPDRDHYFFVATDFRFGIFGDCVQRTMHVFGEELLTAFASDLPKLFNKTDCWIGEKRIRELELLAGGWRQLTYEEKDEFWDDFDAEFQFFSNGRPCAIVEPTPSRTWDISSWYGEETMEQSQFEAALGRHLCAALKQVTDVEGQEVVSMDPLRWYNHFATNPQHLRVNVWPHRLIPADNYCILLSRDLRFGMVGHPLERTICVFGEDLLDALEHSRSFSTAHLIRKDGKPV